MYRMLIPVILLIALIAVSVLSDRPAPRADLVFTNSAEVNTLDPQRMSWMHDLRTARLLYQGLVENDVLSDDFGIIPGVAESWELSPDGLTYTFHLRHNAKWSNGKPVTAEDFRYSWRRAMLPDLVSDYVKMFMNIKGASAFYDWRQLQLEEFPDREFDSAAARQQGAYELWNQTKAKFDELVAMNAPDEHTLIITLEHPVPYFLELCAFAVFSPVYEPLVSQYERPDATSARLIRKPGWTKPRVLVSNGRFVLTEWRMKRDMRMVKNEYFWDKDSIAINSILIPSISDPNASVLAYQTGALDWVANVTAPYRGDMVAQKLEFLEEHREQVERYRAQGLDQFTIDRLLPQDPRAHTHAVSSFGTYFYNFNCKPKLPDGQDNPFFDPRVRRAFAMCVDKRSVADEIRRLGEPTASTLIPPGSIGGYTSPAGLPNIGDAKNQAQRDAIIAQARELLKAADFPEDFIVEMSFNKDSGHDLIAQAIAKSWQQHLGVKTKLEQNELKIFREDLKNKDYMTARAGWFGDYGDPTTFLDINYSTDGNNDRAYNNPAYDALLDRAATELDSDLRMELLSQAERILVEEDLPLIPIFHYATIYMFDPHKVTGLSTHPRTKQNAYLIDILSDKLGPNVPKPMNGRGAESLSSDQQDGGAAP
ncbi:MAG: peptide ABC transporter substrate-binding protein [Phycisphaerales bacterium]|nr:peptide ABC transporter substrate-binding protein [Phycisphaerales bacterium]